MQYSKLGQHTVNAVRLAEMLQVLARHGFADLLHRAGFHNGLPARVLHGLKLRHAPVGEPATLGQRLRSALVDLGPTFIKLGQVLSTRPDLVGNKLAKELGTLRNEVDAVPFNKVEPIISEALGENIDTLFASFDTTAVASASLSQVYRATLSSGKTVAVKVQRPNIEKIIESDLSLMRQIADWVANYVEDTKWFDLPGIVDEFARSIRRELDFNIEARIIDQFRKNFKGNPNVFIPSVRHELSAKHLLTIDWVDGCPVDDLSAYEARYCKPDEVAVIGCDALSCMVFEHCLFHADPHPGNIYITQDNQLAFLDFGMVGHLERTDVAAIADLLLAMFKGDSTSCVGAVLTLSKNEDLKDPDAFEHAIAEFIAFEAQTIIGHGQVAKGIERATQILERFDLELAPRFSLLLKALATIELVGCNLDPKMDMVPIVKPYVTQLVADRYKPIEMMNEMRNNAATLLKLSRQFPGDVSHLLQQLRRGRMKFQIHHEHLENLAGTIDRTSNRNTVGIITAALIVASSLLITTESSVRYVGLAGFVIAGFLGISLVVSILWFKRF